MIMLTRFSERIFNPMRYTGKIFSVEKFKYLPVEMFIKYFLVTVFLLIMNPTEFQYVHNQKENRHYDHLPFNLKDIRNSLFLSANKTGS